MRFDQIPQLPRAYYNTTVSWKYLEDSLDRWVNRSEGIAPLNLNPDFQREHVWTREQQIAYIEYALQGGEVGKNIIFNCPGWMSNFRGPFELIDGKQRLNAVLAFLHDEFRVFGHLFSQFEGPMSFSDLTFNFQVCQLETREEILRLYLNINAGGTPHSKEELDRVRALLKAAEKGG